MSDTMPDRRAALASALCLLPVLHPLLRPIVGVPSHLLWFVLVLPVAWWTYHYGRAAGAAATAASVIVLLVGERSFGAGYFVAADWPTALSLAVAVGFICALVAGFALYARSMQALQHQLWHSQKLETLGLFAGSVAHDFSNVLTAIILSAELALEELPVGHPVRGLVAEIRESADRAAVLTKRLLSFGRRDLVKGQEVDLNAVIQELEVMLRRIIPKQVELRVRLGTPGKIYSDPGHIEQIMTNLVVNASDAMPGGGVISIETRAVRTGDEFLPDGLGGAAAGDAMLSVSDTGLGIDERTRKHIFEPLFTTKPPGKGTGLGLSTVQSLANAWGGFVTVTSAPQHGSTFRVFLPVTSATVTRAGTTEWINQ